MTTKERRSNPPKMLTRKQTESPTAQQEMMRQRPYKTPLNKKRRPSIATPAALIAQGPDFTTRKAKPLQPTRIQVRPTSSTTYVPIATTSQECPARIGRRTSRGWKSRRIQTYPTKMRHGQTPRHSSCLRAWKTSTPTGMKSRAMLALEQEKSAS